jgi:hypothetical protein
MKHMILFSTFENFVKNIKKLKFHIYQFLLQVVYFILFSIH